MTNPNWEIRWAGDPGSVSGSRDWPLTVFLAGKVGNVNATASHMFRHCSWASVHQEMTPVVARKKQVSLSHVRRDSAREEYEIKDFYDWILRLRSLYQLVSSHYLSLSIAWVKRTMTS